MNKIVSSLAALGTIGVLSLVSTTPATAAMVSFNNGGGQRDMYVSNYCDSHSRDRDCRDWRMHNGQWSSAHYQSWYRSHNFDGRDVAAGFFGFTLGVIANSVINSRNDNMGSSHVADCQARFRSYDADSDTYMGYDGDRHECML